jgi:hypothetical protein
VVPEIEKIEWAHGVDLQEGVNAVDLTDLSLEMQHLVIRSTISWVLNREKNTVVVIPEAWKFIPQGRGTPVKLAAESFIRQAAAMGNYLWLDSQDLGGAHGNGSDPQLTRDRRGQEGPGRQPGEKSDRPDSDGDMADAPGASGTEQGRKSRRASRRHSSKDHAPESGRADQGLADAAEQHGRGREHAAPVSRWGDTLLADAERERRQRGSVGSDEPEDERSWSETFDAITRLHWEPYQWTSCSDDKFRRTPDEPFDVVNGLHRSVLAALGNAILPQAAFPILHAMRPHVR